jgi:hypothetical protein
MENPRLVTEGSQFTLLPQHSCRGILSLDDEQRGNIERECRPRHNQDECHMNSCRDVRETNGTPQPSRHKKNPRKQGCIVFTIAAAPFVERATSKTRGPSRGPSGGGFQAP